MMQRVTNLEMLKLSHWNPAKSMLSLVVEIRDFLQRVATLEVGSDRNNMYLFPAGAYYAVENLLLRLALVTEISPRLGEEVLMDVPKAPSINLVGTGTGASGGSGMHQTPPPSKLESPSPASALGGGGGGGGASEGANTASEPAATVEAAAKKKEHGRWASGTGYGHRYAALTTLPPFPSTFKNMCP